MKCYTENFFCEIYFTKISFHIYYIHFIPIFFRFLFKVCLRACCESEHKEAEAKAVWRTCAAIANRTGPFYSRLLQYTLVCSFLKVLNFHRAASEKSRFYTNECRKQTKIFFSFSVCIHLATPKSIHV